MMKNKMVEVRQLAKSFAMGKGRLEVLRGIDLEILEGEFLAICGPSGVGKSTLLHLMGALDTPSAGKVFFQGVDLYRLSESARSRVRNEKIGFVFQFYHLLPEFSALENVALPSLIYGNGRRNGRQAILAKAASLLAEVGMSRREKHRPSQLSGGEQQRLAIARALMNDPQLLLADEPTGNLDSKTGESIKELLMQLNQKKKQTLVIVTHDEKWAAQSDRTLHMMDGKIYGSLHQR